jgi:signal peptidase II
MNCLLVVDVARVNRQRPESKDVTKSIGSVGNSLAGSFGVETTPESGNRSGLLGSTFRRGISMTTIDSTLAPSKRFLYFAAPVILMGVLADQSSKSWASVGAVEPRFLIPGYVVAYSVQNAGATLGLGSEQGGTSGIFAVLGIACGIVLARITYLDRNCWKVGDFLAVGLIFAGIFGNVLDRLVLGHVRDFLVTWAIPTLVFNFADTLVVAGSLALLITRYRGSGGLRSCFRLVSHPAV